MNPHRLAIGCVALAATAIGFAVWQQYRLNRVRAMLAAERAAFQARPQDLEPQILELRTSPAGVTQSADGERLEQERREVERRFHQDLAKRRAQEARARAAAQERFRLTPEVQQSQFRQFELELAARYRPLFRNLKLSAEQVAQFEKLMGERYWAWSDLLATRLETGTSPDDAAFEVAKQQALAPLDQNLRALLGETGMDHYRNFELAANGQALIQAVAGRLFDSETPLSAAQADQLLTIFSEHNQRTDVAGSDDSWLLAMIQGGQSGGTTQWTDLDWAPVRSQLESILSPEQLNAVQALRDQAEARQQARLIRVELESEFRRRNEAPSPAAAR